jgi:exonuclease SbcC
VCNCACALAINSLSDDPNLSGAAVRKVRGTLLHASRVSGGQFDLTHEDGDLYVIDHTDADSRRSGRTLSGGETFQASLALALSLSAQMWPGGSRRSPPRLHLPGRGVRHPGARETLEVVATTLKTLAQGQRMVDVITHVAALAEQVPVRFKVSRNARTSSVIRAGIVPAEGAA